MVHEALGHCLTSWLVGDRVVSISTVALQTATPNRLVSASGTMANCFIGAVSLLLLRLARPFTSFSYFLWLFGAFNLFNSGYLVASAGMNSGDWASVVAGFSPPVLWRIVLALVGATLYGLAMIWTAQSMTTLVNHGDVAQRDLGRFTLPAYLAGGVVMTIASFFNPISPSLILTSGVGSSFGLSCGLLFIPGIVASRARNQVTLPIPFNPFWVILALILGIAFIAVMGPGIQFS
jgi:hypothetical protein